MNQNYPEVSIIVTNFNYGKYISRCLRSCLSQKNVKFEVIVVDDCSTDNSMEILKSFKNDIRIYQTDKNSGVAVASNIGIRNAKGQFIVRVDSDDYVSENMCFFLKTYLQSNKDAFCVSCDYNIVDDHEQFIERKYASKDNVSCGIMYRRDLLIELGGYNSDMRHREEEELRKRLGDFYNIHHLNIPFYRYRMHDTNKTKTNEYKRTIV